MACQDCAYHEVPDDALETFTYRAHGMAIWSDIALPQLPPVGDAPAPDLRIFYGIVRAGVESRPRYRRGQVYDQFRYEVIDGREIVIEPLAGSSPENIADLITSRLLTAAVYQQGRLPLHASAVSTPRGLVAICGPSGAGKSTLAAALLARGGELFADDMLVLHGGEDAFCASGGAAALKLSQRSLAHHCFSADGLPRANSVEAKFLLPFGGPRSDRPARLVLLVQLMLGRPGIHSVDAFQAISRWSGCIRMPDLLHVAPDPHFLWKTWMELGATVPVVAVSHGNQLSALRGLVEGIEDAMSQASSRGGA